MNAEHVRANERPDREVTDRNIQRPTRAGRQTGDDIVEAFSKSFEQELRKILGDRYVERPDRGS